MLRSTRFVPATSLLALVAMMAGCGTTGLAGANTNALSVRPVTTAKTAAAHPVAKSAASFSAPETLTLTAAKMGSVSVAFPSLHPAQRSVLDVNAIAKITITLAASNGVTQTQTLNATQLAAPNPGATFTGVVAGNATITVTSFDASGNVIGSGTSNVTVVAGQTAAATISVTLVQTLTGNVNAAVTFVLNGSTTGTTASPSPAASTGPAFVVPANLDVWGRFYNYAGTQLLTGTVRYISMDSTHPYDQTVQIRADGYYYLPGVPTGVKMEIIASSGQLSDTSSVTVTEASDVGYDWVDLFLALPT